MKYSFLTKGWHNNTFEEFCDVAKDLKFKGIELHNIYNRLFTDKDGAFHDYTAAATVRKLYEMKLELPCIDTICNIVDASKETENIEEITACMEIAANLKIPYIRLHASESEYTEEKNEIAVSIIEKVLPLAEEKGVTLLVETSGIYCNTTKLRELLDRFACDNLAALWDMYSPYFIMGEQADATIKNLGAYIKHVHIKDAVKTENGIEFCLMGEGEMPIEDMMLGLRSVNYVGFISLEWDP